MNFNHRIVVVAIDAIEARAIGKFKRAERPKGDPPNKKQNDAQQKQVREQQWYVFLFCHSLVRNLAYPQTIVKLF